MKRKQLASTEEAAPDVPESDDGSAHAGASADLDAQKLARTVYIGNVPASTSRKELKKHFTTFGSVDSVRLRAAAAANPKMSQRAAAITGEVAGNAISAFVVFEQPQAARAAVASTGEDGRRNQEYWATRLEALRGPSALGGDWS